MNQEEIDRLQAELNEYKSKRDDKTSLTVSILTAGKKLGDKHITYELDDGVSFDIYPRAPNEIKERFVKTLSLIEDEQSTSAIVNFPDICAELLSSVCVDDELKSKEFWLKFDEVSGCMCKLAMSIFADLYISAEDMRNFRKKR